MCCCVDVLSNCFTVILLFSCVVIFVYCHVDVSLHFVVMLFCCFFKLLALCIILLMYYCIVVLVCIVNHVDLSVHHQGTFERTAAAMLI